MPRSLHFWPWCSTLRRWAGCYASSWGVVEHNVSDDLASSTCSPFSFFALHQIWAFVAFLVRPCTAWVSYCCCLGSRRPLGRADGVAVVVLCFGVLPEVGAVFSSSGSLIGLWSTIIWRIIWRMRHECTDSRTSRLHIEIVLQSSHSPCYEPFFFDFWWRQNVACNQFFQSRSFFLLFF